MRVPNRILISTLLLICSAGLMLANEINFLEVTNKEEWNKAFERAKAENKLVFVDIYTDWCTYCHKLDQEVYTNEKVVDYFNEHFINLKFDAETAFGYPLTEKYDVTGYPKLLFLTAKQTVFESIDGFVPSEVLIEYGKNAAGSWETLPSLLTQYADGKLGKDDQLRLIGILERTDQERAEILAATYIRALKEKDYEDIENIWLVSRFQNQLTSASYQYISGNKDKIIGLHGRTEYDDYMKSVYNDNLNLAIKYEDPKLLNRLVLEGLPEFLEKVEIPEAAFITKKLYYKERAELDNYKFEIQSYLSNHVKKEDRPSFLFQNSLEIIESFEDKDMYKFASKLLNQALTQDEKNFESTALLGYVNGIMGNYKTATDFLDKAKGLATGSDEKEMVDNLAQAVDMMKSN